MDILLIENLRIQGLETIRRLKLAFMGITITCAIGLFATRVYGQPRATGFICGRSLLLKVNIVAAQ